MISSSLLQFSINSDDRRNFQSSILAIVFLIAGVSIALIYSKALNGIFLLDDIPNIRPALVQEVSWDAFWSATLSNTSGELKRPISAASFAITSVLHGDGVWGFKYHNLLIHLLVGLLVFVMCYSLQKHTIIFYAKQDQETSAHRVFISSIAISLIWLAHPLHVSTVLYSVQRMTQLAAMFSLAAIIAYVIARTTPTYSKKLIFYFFLVPFFSIAAILSKENGVLLIFLFLLTHVFICQRGVGSSKLDSILIWLGSILPMLIGLSVFAIKHQYFLDYSSRDFTLYERLLTQIDVVFSYLNNLLLPRLSAMSLYLDDTVIRSNWDAELVAKLFILMAILIAGAISFKRGRLFGYGILFFYLGHLLESTVIPLELAFEHRNYLPSVGIFISAVAFITETINSKKITAISLVVFPAMLMALLVMRVSFWSDSNNWLKTTLAYSPKSERTQLDYLNEVVNRAGERIATQEALKVANLIPNKVSFKFLYLLYGCESSELPEKHRIANQIVAHLEKNNLTVPGFNHLAALLQQISKTRCLSTDMSIAFEIIDAALYRGPDKSDHVTAQLYFLKALLISSQGLTLKASNTFEKSYQLDPVYRYKLASIKALLSHQRSQDKGVERLVEQLNKQDSLPATDRDALHELQDKLNTGKFQFSY